MIRPLLLVAVAALAAGFVPASATAQDTVRRAGTVVRTPSYASLMSAVAATSSAADRITARTSLTRADVRIVDVADHIDSVRLQSLETALQQQTEQLPALRDAVSKSQPIAAALAAHAAKPAASQVVAVDIGDAGDVIVYFRK